MNGDSFISLLGRTLDHPEVKAFLAQCGISKRPKLKRGDLDADVINPKLGLEIGFRDERYLDVKSKEYEEGALVLWNVTMYGDAEDYERFAGDLPLGLEWSLGRKEVRAKLDRKPAWEDKKSGDARWDFEGYCLFVTFGKPSTRIRNLALQLPVG